MTDAERQTVESIRSRIRKWDRHEVDKDSYYALGVDGAVSDAAVLLDLLDEAIASTNTDAAPEGAAPAWIEQSVRSSERTNAVWPEEHTARDRSDANDSERDRWTNELVGTYCMTCGDWIRFQEDEWCDLCAGDGPRSGGGWIVGSGITINCDDDYDESKFDRMTNHWGGWRGFIGTVEVVDA